MAQQQHQIVCHCVGFTFMAACLPNPSTFSSGNVACSIQVKPLDQPSDGSVSEQELCLP